MDVALLLILPVIGGYFFATYWNLTRFRIAREEGHRLYFRAVFSGAILFFVAYLLRALLLHFSAAYNDFEAALPPYLDPLLQPPDADKPPWRPYGILLTSVYALLLGLTLWLPLNLLVWVEPSLRRAIRDNDFERLIHTSARQGMPLALTMENKKVYIGFVVKTIDPRQARKWLGILPLISGFRREDGRLMLTTYYTDIYAKIAGDGKQPLAHLSVDDFEVVLPVDKINSANMFDLVAYEEFGRAAANAPPRTRAKTRKQRKQAARVKAKRKKRKGRRRKPAA